MIPASIFALRSLNVKIEAEESFKLPKYRQMLPHQRYN
jgi:hypothetical protein